MFRRFASPYGRLTLIVLNFVFKFVDFLLCYLLKVIGELFPIL